MADFAPRGVASSVFDRVRAWTFDQALPLWSTVGRDEEGLGFRERLARDGSPDGVTFKRVRVQARQIYVFSHAHLLGWNDGLAAAEAGYRFLVDHARLDDGGWAKMLDRRGRITDPTLDLYDQAFVLTALAWFHRATGDPEPLHLARETMVAIDARLGLPDGRGWRSAAPDPLGWRLQNPHMHMLEAMCFWHEATEDDEWAARAARIGELFASTLFDARTGTLAECFDSDWRRLSPAVIEPGHHFEWVWLLARLARVTSREYRPEANALFAFASMHGLTPDTRRAVDELTDQGAVIAAGGRLWPQTELLKAHLVRAERGAVDVAAIEQTVANIFDLYLDPAPAGCWRDKLDAQGAVVDEPVPASTLYHLFLAFAELLRLRPLIEAKL